MQSNYRFPNAIFFFNMLLLAATLAIIALAIVNLISNSIITKAGVVFEMAWQETEIIFVSACGICILISLIALFILKLFEYK